MTKRPTLDQKPSKAELEKQLDDALQQTFPASDPLTVGEPTAFIADRPAHRQTPLLVTDWKGKEARSALERRGAHGALRGTWEAFRRCFAS